MRTKGKQQKKKSNKAGIAIGLTALLLLLFKRGKSNPYKYINPATGQISKYYFINQVTQSATATELNYQPQFNPPEEIWINAAYVATKLLDPLKDKLPTGSIVITSWYRSPFINDKVGGVPDSLHLLAYAVDLKYIVNGQVDNNTLVGAIRDILKYEWNELILEEGPEINPNFVHIALVPDYNIGEIFYKNSSGQYLARSKDWLTLNFSA